MKHLLLSSETVIPDDYPVYYEYAYIGDMKFIRNMILFKGTVGQLKKEMNLKEIRKCNLFGHPGARLGDELTTDINE